MTEPIVSRDRIQTLARAAAQKADQVNVTNPYPPLTEAHALWEISFEQALAEVGSG